MFTKLGVQWRGIGDWRRSPPLASCRKQQPNSIAVANASPLLMISTMVCRRTLQLHRASLTVWCQNRVLEKLAEVRVTEDLVTRIIGQLPVELTVIAFVLCISYTPAAEPCYRPCGAVQMSFRIGNIEPGMVMATLTDTQIKLVAQGRLADRGLGLSRRANPCRKVVVASPFCWRHDSRSVAAAVIMPEAR